MRGERVVGGCEDVISGMVMVVGEGNVFMGGHVYSSVLIVGLHF